MQLADFLCWYRKVKAFRPTWKNKLNKRGFWRWIRVTNADNIIFAAKPSTDTQSVKPPVGPVLMTTRISPTFRSKLSPPSSGWKKKPNKKLAWSNQHDFHRTAPCYTLMDRILHSHYSENLESEIWSLPPASTVSKVMPNTMFCVSGLYFIAQPVWMPWRKKILPCRESNPDRAAIPAIPTWLYRLQNANVNLLISFKVLYLYHTINLNKFYYD